MKCTKCKGDGRQLSNGKWEMCERCITVDQNGNKRATGIEPEPVPVPVPTTESVMAAGFDEREAAAILRWEEAKTQNDGKPPAAVPVAPAAPVPTNILSVTPVTRIGKHAKLKSGGPEMTITADLGGDELVCEWEVASAQDGVPPGKESHVFQAASLNIQE
jgi:uncharacterized protein YodC (DUF2158 family)